MFVKSLTLENFKKYEKETIDLSSAITLLVGPNSSGKSSIIKAILGVKQSFSQANEGEVFASLGEYVDLGTYADYVHDHDTSKSITIGIEFDFSQDTSNKLFWIRNLGDSLGLNSFKVSFTFDHEYSTDQARIKSITTELKGKSYSGAFCRIDRKMTRPTYRFSIDSNFLEQLIQLDNNKLMLEHPEKLIGATTDLIHTSKFSFSESTKSTKQREMRYVRFYFDNIIEMAAAILAKETFYLGPLRKSPSRSYVRTAHSIAVGPTGEYTPSVLANLGKKKMKATTGNSIYVDNSILLEKWVRDIFPNKSIETVTIDELVKLKVFTKDKKGAIGIPDNISDVGFGMSQVVPLLAQAAVMAPGNTLIIEQPELHLHPMAQNALARVIADAARNGRRFIIETHSEHFIRGLQVAVSEYALNDNNGIPHTSLNTIYIHKTPIETKYLKTDRTGSYTEEWPTGFFDEGYKIAYKLLKNKSTIASLRKGK